MKKSTQIVAMVVILIIAIMGLVYPSVSQKVGDVSDIQTYNNTSFTGNVGVSQLNVGPLCTDANSTYCVGQSIYGGLNSTSTTATAYTAVGADIAGYSAIFLTPNKGALTLTLPSTSTLATSYPGYLNQPGDTTSFTLYNASTTAGITITIAAGTGSLLEQASSSVIIAPGRKADFSVLRKSNTDLIYSMTNFY